MISRGGFQASSVTVAGVLLLALCGTSRAADDLGLATRKKLEQRIELTFENQPLRDVLVYFAQVLDVQVHTQWRRLEESGIAPDIGVTIALKDVRASTALELLLEEVSDGSVSYYVRDNVVIITILTNAANAWQPRVYLVKDLVEPLSLEGARGMMGNPGMPGMPGGAGMMMPGMMGGGGGMAGPMQSGEAPPPGAGFLDLVMSAVAPNSWVSNGGQGNIEYYQGYLVVKNSVPVQDDVGTLLDEMRKARESDQDDARAIMSP